MHILQPFLDTICQLGEIGEAPEPKTSPRGEVLSYATDKGMQGVAEGGLIGLDVRLSGYLAMYFSLAASNAPLGSKLTSSSQAPKGAVARSVLPAARHQRAVHVQFGQGFDADQDVQPVWLQACPGTGRGRRRRQGALLSFVTSWPCKPFITSTSPPP
jgi:hypothetical protein